MQWLVLQFNKTKDIEKGAFRGESPLLQESPNIHDMILDAERESFKEAARIAKAYNIQLVFLKGGEEIERLDLK